MLPTGAKVEGSFSDPLQRQHAPIRHDLHQAKSLASTKNFGEHIPAKRIQAEAEAAGWKLIRTRKVFPILSENVLLILTAK